MDLLAYYAERRRHLAALTAKFPDGVCYLCSVDNRMSGTVAGSVTAVANDNAARCLTEKTHRLATDDEVQRWRELQESNLRTSQQCEYRGKALYVVPPQSRESKQ